MNNGERSFARILTSDGQVRGSGVLTLGDKILTSSAPVALVATGETGSHAADVVGHQVWVDFPNVSAARIPAQVFMFMRDLNGEKRGGIAGVQLNSAAPSECESALLDRSPAWNHGMAIDVWGASGTPLGAGTKVDATIGVSARQRTEFVVEESGRATIEAGFMGGPVRRGNAVLGVVLDYDVARGRGYFARVQTFTRALDAPAAREAAMPELPVRLLRWFRSDALGGLLDDLTEMESDGLDPRECEAIQVGLGKIANAVSELEIGPGDAVPPTALAVSNTLPLYTLVEELLETYRDWNSHDPGPDGVGGRSRDISRLRKKRRDLKEQLRNVGAVFYNDDAVAPLMRVVKAFEQVVQRFPDRFPSLAQAVDNYPT